MNLTPHCASRPRAPSISSEAADANSQINLARRLREAGVDLVCYTGFWPDDGIGLDPENIPEFLKDPDSVMARKLGVSLNHFQRFRKFALKEYRCTGRTKRGRRCQKQAVQYVAVDKCRWGIDDRCHAHQDVEGGRA